MSLLLQQDSDQSDPLPALHISIGRKIKKRGGFPEHRYKPPVFVSSFFFYEKIFAKLVEQFVDVHMVCDPAVDTKDQDGITTVFGI